MQFIPVIESLGSVLPSQGDPNVSELQDLEQWPGGFSAILESELEADKTSSSNEEDGETQDVLLGFVPAIYGEALSGSDVDNGFMLDDMLSDVIEGESDFTEKMTQPESSPDVVLLNGQAKEGEGVEGKEVDIVSQFDSDQTISAAKGRVEMPGNPTTNSMSEHAESVVNPEKVIAIEALQQEGSDKPVFQKTGDLLGERVVKVSGEGIEVLQKIDSIEVKEKPETFPGDMKSQLVEETVGSVKPLSKTEGKEIQSSYAKESFEKNFQLDNSPKTAAHVSDNENSHAREDAGSFRSNKDSAALNLQKTTPQDSKVNFAQITTMNSTETVQGTIEAAQGIAVDLSTEVDTVSVKEVKPQTVSHAFEDQVMDQVSNSVRLTMKQGGGEARMRLYPESLGELKIELSVEDGVMKAKFLVNNSMVKDVIEDNFARLRDSLTNNGLKVESFSVSVDQQGKGSNLESSSFSQFQGANITDTETPVIDQHEGLPEHSKAHSGADDSMINIFT